MLTAGKQKMAEWLRKNSRYRVVVALVLLAGLCGRPNDAIAQGAPPAAKPGGDQAQQLQKMIEDVFKGASPATKADGDQAQQIQKMMEGFFNGVLDGAGNQQTPDNSANIQKLFEKLIEAEGGKGEQAKAQACLLPIMIPRIPGQNDKMPTQRTRRNPTSWTRIFQIILPWPLKRSGKICSKSPGKVSI